MHLTVINRRSVFAASAQGFMFMFMFAWVDGLRLDRFIKNKS